MNPLASTKCARRLLMALAATISILLTAGCGSSGGPVPPLGGSFSNASLNGQYVMKQTGTGINQQGTAVDPFSETSVFTADGKGNLTITVDDFDQVGGPYGGVESLAGTYHINSDGTGYLIFKYTTPSNYSITMIDDSHFYLIEGDTYATSSGYGVLQDTSAFGAPPSGAFVFKGHNVDTSSRVGGVSIAGGAITGTEDFLTLGTLFPNQPISSTVAMSSTDANGRGTFTLSDGSSFNYYVVNSTEFYFMSNSASGSLEIGQAEAQTGGPFSAATLASGNSYVFGSAGDTTVSGPAGIHSAGVFTTDGVSAITGGTVDYVQDTTVNSNLAVSGGTYTLASNGRGTINLSLVGGSISPQIFWMINGTSAYFLANNTAAVEDGTFSLQQAAPTLSGQAAFVMDGFDSGGLKDRVGDFEPTNSGAFNWNQTANSFLPSSGSGIVSSLGTNGTYTVSSNGRVAVVVNGVTSSVVFYLSSANTGFMVQEDADVGGAFTQQASQ
ncbi:MAG: hypothetical protein ABR920_18040 [Terriglobales bacterium]